MTEPDPLDSHRRSERQLGAEQVEAHGLAAELMSFPLSDRLTRVRDDARHHTASFAEIAMTLARDTDRERDDARCWAQLAIAAARRSTQLRARELLPLAWAVLGNHHRCASELFRAEAAFARCRELHEEIADPLDLAECMSLEASYWREVRNFQQAEALLQIALSFAEKFGAGHLRAKLRVQVGMLYVEAERWDDAIESLCLGVKLAQREDLPALALCAAHNLVEVLVELEIHDWACACLCDLEPFYEKHGTDRQKLQRRWMLGRIALRRGHLPEAVARLQKVQDQLLTENDPYFASLVQLDLVETHVGLGDWQEAERAAAAAAAGLSACGATTEARVAVEYLRDGLRQRLGVRALRDLLARARTRARTSR